MDHLTKPSVPNGVSSDLTPSSSAVLSVGAGSITSGKASLVDTVDSTPYLKWIPRQLKDCVTVNIFIISTQINQII